MDLYEQESATDCEFDGLAQTYDQEHRNNIAIAGEEPAYYSEYKVRDLFGEKMRYLPSQLVNVLDFGCGIGNSIPFLLSYFQECSLTLADVSLKSMEVARKRTGLNESAFVHISESIPLEDVSQDIVFSSCVFHHIQPEKRVFWLSELYRVTRYGGMMLIYEHNPLNPLTRYTVNNCPFDKNAVLLRAYELKQLVRRAGWYDPMVNYRVFFPSFFKLFRPLERYLKGVPLGAQYYVLARKVRSDERK